MQTALARKLDVVVRAQNIPKNVVDLLTMLVAHASDSDGAHDELSRRVAATEAATVAPTSELTKAHDVALKEVASLRQQTMQLEHTIREAQSSLLTHLEMKQAQLRCTMQQLQEEAEVLLRDAIPGAMQQHLAKFAMDVRRVGDLAVAAAAKRLHTTQAEATKTVHDVCIKTAQAAIDKAEEDIDVLQFKWRRRIEEEVERAEANFRAASMAASATVNKCASDCMSFMASRLELSNIEPLVELHRLAGEVQFCSATLHLVSDATPSHMEVRDLQSRLSLLEQVSLIGHAQTRGLVSLLDIDEEVVQELGAAPGGITTDSKLKYIESLPLFGHVRLAAASGRPAAASVTPPRIAAASRAALMQEITAKKASPPPSVPESPPHEQKSGVPHGLSLAGGGSMFVVPLNVMTPERLPSGPASLRDSLASSAASSVPLSPPAAALAPLGLEISDGDPLVGGVNIVAVAAQSIAERYGFAVRDVVVSVNGAKIKTREDFAAAIGVRSLKFTVYRPESAKVHTIAVLRQ
jgi:hypothetical protein